jgi:hypothetical protein
MRITINNIDDVFKSKQLTRESAELRGYKLIKEFFVDNSGFGSESEPAYTASSFVSELENLFKEYPQVHTFLTGVGQFQVYVGCFVKTKRPENIKKLAPNTYRIETENGYNIRLYDTDIISVDLKKQVFTLNSGGYNTLTTRERIRRFLPCDYGFYQNRGKWYLIDHNNNNDIEVKEGQEIAFKN